MDTQRPSHHIPTLDGWRAIAIAAVIACHGLSLTAAANLRHPLFGTIVLSLGQQGVSLFFAISGFLITTLLLDELSSRGSISLRGFYIRRVFRILPPAYTYLFITAVFGLMGWIKLAHGEIASGLFVYNNYWPHRSWYTQHFWSLSMEEHFYLFWPALLALLGLARARWAAVALVVATVMWRPWSLAHIHWQVPQLQRTDMRLDAFLLACLLAILIHGDAGKRIAVRIASVRFHAAIIAVLVAVYAVALLVPRLQLFRLLVQSAFLPLVVVPTVFLPGYWLSRWLETGFLRWVGRISYSLYLWQQMVLHGDAQDIPYALKTLPFKLIVLFALGYASYRWIELPMMQAGRRRAARFLAPPPPKPSLAPELAAGDS